MNTNFEIILEECRPIIEMHFTKCDLKEIVERRILELVQEWERRKAEADRKGRKIGGLRIIPKDLRRAVGLAHSLSERSVSKKCEYLRKWLNLPFTVPGGLGYWSIIMWQ